MTVLKSKPSFHKKGWGHELWICNSEKYCGKLLFFKKGKKCSYHYHKLKDEVFYLQSGKIIVRWNIDSDEFKGDEPYHRLILRPGNTFHVKPGMRHQMEALEDSELFEFSTQHFEEDSYRVIKGD